MFSVSVGSVVRYSSEVGPVYNYMCNDIITLDVGGTIFRTTRATLMRYPDSLLAHMFQPASAMAPPRLSNGAYWLDRSPDRFKIVLDYLRDGRPIKTKDMPPHMAAAIRDEAAYFRLPYMIYKYEAKVPKEPSTKVFNVSPLLAHVIGVRYQEKVTRSEVCKRVWAYLKARNLQDPQNKQYFTPNAVLAPIFGTERMKAFNMLKYLKPHLYE